MGAIGSASRIGAFAFDGHDFGYRCWGEACASEAGLAKRCWVLLHGFAQSADAWDEIGRMLSADASEQVFALDLPGHGSGSKLRDPQMFSLTATCDLVEAFLRFARNQTGARPVLVGYSMGARVALELAVRCVRAAEAAGSPLDALPFSALVLESGGLGPADDAARAALRERNFGWARRLREEGLEPFMNWWEQLELFASQRALPQERRDALRAGRMDNDAASLALSFEGAGQQCMCSRNEAIRTLETLAATSVPVLYVAGCLDAKYCAVADDLRKSIEGDAAIEVRVIPEAGHNVHFEQPRAFAEALLRVRACNSSSQKSPRFT